MKNRKDERKGIVPREYWMPISIFDEMERVFDSFRGTRDLWLPSMATGYRTPVMDVKDNGTEYVIEAEFPGMRKEDIEIEIVKGGLMISAKKDEIKEDRDEGFIRRERGSLSFHRQLPLPGDSNIEGIEARLEEGVLHIDIPKKEKPEEKKRLVEVK
jgi:HSP20 family protein